MHGRNTAARLLLERADTRVGGSLRSLARGSKLPETRIHASGLLGYFQAWDLEAAFGLSYKRVIHAFELRLGVGFENSISRHLQSFGVSQSRH